MGDKSTPRPWKADSPPYDKIVIQDAIGTIATISGRFVDGKRCDAANAALIVKAVNHHEGLVEALEDTAESLELWAAERSMPVESAPIKADAENSGVLNVLRRARAVLKKARASHA